MQPNPATHGAPRIGIAFPGDPLDRTTWSGSPAGIARGLQALGAEPVPIRALPCSPLDTVAVAAISLGRLRPGMLRHPREAARRARRATQVSHELGVVWSLAARRAVRNAGPLDGVIQVGTGYDIRHPRVSTFEDITIAQAIQYPYPGWPELSHSAVARRIEHQRRVYQRSTACCLSTGWAAGSVIEDYRIDRRKVHAVGVGRNHDPQVGARSWVHPRFLFIGKDWEGKNGAGLVRAFARVREVVPEAHLDLVGRHPAMDIPGVTGHGYLSLADPDGRRRVDDLLRRATCFVLPSHFEASAIAYVEAAAAGLPSIGSSAGGSADLIGDGGKIVNPTDPDGLVHAMLDLCRPEEAARIGAIALERSRLFTWPAVAGRLLRSLAIPGYPVDGLPEFLS